LNNKGQASFEVLLIAAVIIILSLTVVSKFFSLSDSFTAMAILKESCLEKVGSSSEFHSIQKIDYSIPTPGQIDLTVYFKPVFASCPIDVMAVSSSIKNNTRYAAVNIHCA